uniref:NADH-ubiquinone oxidoreductase chain 2 n=1 Tax=Gyge ovalis TaxID=2008693 RepID=A0A343DSC6_9CRUS|nr:NADH dehydrogenase subunit 2 [Gyge ovalis]ASC43033.1 NADH dehydrogenase subunit 2 [Gyge ovalis]
MHLKGNMTMCMLLLILLSLLMGLSSLSWMGYWISLELNTIAFLGMVCILSGSNYSGGMKYFMVQSSCSFLLIFSTFSAELASSDVWALLVLFSLMVKVGASPFHMWVPLVSGELEWAGNIILLTLQKIIPMALLCLLYNSSMESIYILIGGLSCIVGGVSGWGELSLRKLMSFSSINHVGWMVVCSMMGEGVWTIYFIVYSLLSLGVMSLMKIVDVWNMNDLWESGESGLRFSLSMLLLSLSGIPPMTGFYPKWVVLEASYSVGLGPMVLFMLVASIVLMSFYLRLVLFSLTFHSKGLVKSKFYLWGPISLLSTLGWAGLEAFGLLSSSLQHMLLL